VCGRYASTTSDKDIAAAFGVGEIIGDEPPPSWNVAPTQQARVVLERAPRTDPDAEPIRQLRSLTWGLVPSWAKEAKLGRLINARSETVTEKPAFKTAASRRRCLVPADGYYEWEKRDGKKIPHFLHHDDDLLAFAGLYELRPDRDLPDDHPDKWLWTYTILTTTAHDAAGHIHDRSPVLIPPQMRDQWLDPDLTDPGDIRDLLSQVPEPVLQPYEVSTRVNNPQNNGPELVEPSALAG
jgi:putative SOS response-associated peptidase YedK